MTTAEKKLELMVSLVLAVTCAIATTIGLNSLHNVIVEQKEADLRNRMEIAAERIALHYAATLPVCSVDVCAFPTVDENAAGFE